MGPGWDRIRDPGSAARLASVASHITDCATGPSGACEFVYTHGIGKAAFSKAGHLLSFTIALTARICNI